MLNQARIALLAAILLCVLYVASFVSQTLAFVSSGSATVSYAASLLGRECVDLALPLMLALWFRSGATITLTKNLRRWAVGTAIVFGACFIASPILGWAIMIIRGWSLHLTLWSILRRISELALMLLLIALSWRSGDAPPERNSGLGLLRRAALAATIAAVVAVVLNTSQLVHSARMLMAQQYGAFMDYGGGHVEYELPPTLPQLALGFAVSGLPPLCKLMVPLIVYKSLIALPPESVGAAAGNPQQV
jgi:hypothetical protein